MTTSILVIVLLLVVAGVSAMVGWLVAGRSAGYNRQQLAEDVMQRAAHDISAETVATLRAEQQEQLQSVMDAVMSVASSTLGGQLAVGKEVLSGERQSVVDHVSQLSGELQRVTDLVNTMSRERAVQTGRLESGLQETLRATAALNDTTQTLNQALASPKARGQWGERMAEDVLRAAGFVEGTNYRKQKKATGGGVPDFTFPLPTGQVVHMDVKFPMDNYHRWLTADDDAQRDRFVAAFRKDVRNRVKELEHRAYVDAESTVDYQLLFVPNESVYGFLHEHDSDLIDYSLGRKVVLCSPTTLFAVLAVIRQAIDNFMVEQRSHEILAALSELRVQWDRWDEPIEKMRRGLDSAHRAFDDLAGPRKRAFEKQLEKLEAHRDDDLGAVIDSVGPARTPDSGGGPLRQVS